MSNDTILLTLILAQTCVAFLCLYLERKSARRLIALRAKAYLTDHDGVRRKYHKVRADIRSKAEG